MAESHPEAPVLSHQYELAVIGEECGEVIQIIGKTLRFGYDSYHPDDPTESNLDLLHEELGDILAAVDLAVERGLLDRETLTDRQTAKLAKLRVLAPVSDGIRAPLPTPPTGRLVRENHVPGDAHRNGMVLLFCAAVIAMFLIFCSLMGRAHADAYADAYAHATVLPAPMVNPPAAPEKIDLDPSSEPGLKE